MRTKRAVAYLGAGALLLAVLLFAVGSVRYGGPRGIYHRLQAFASAVIPHPAYVPTALPTPTGGADVDPLARATTAAATTAQPIGTAAPARETSTAPQPTASPTHLPTPTATPTATATPAYVPATERVDLSGFRHQFQTWNNCGPATLSMCLSFYDSPLSQEDIRLVLRPNPEDKHVGPDELAQFARDQGFHAVSRVSGTAETLRLLLSNGVPVMVATWHEAEKGNGMGHYRLLTGYDDAVAEWIVYDSLAATAPDRNAPYVGVRLSYADLEELWKVFNYTYIVVYDDARAPTVEGILGDEMDDAAMWAGALERSRQAAETHPDDAFSWFNLGTNLLAAGQHAEAAAAYDRARQVGLPWRMLWYQFGPLEAYYRTGRYEEVVALADATLARVTDVEELHYWRGLSLQALGDTTAARQALEMAIALQPHYAEAAAALSALQ